jgi:integrase
MLRQAREDELLTPERLADLTALEWPTSTTPEPDPFTAEERTRLLGWFEMRTFRVAAALGSAGYVLQPDPAYHAYLHLLFWSGMRPSEAAGLHMQDVDLDRGIATVRRSRHLWTYGEPKTSGARHTVQLFPETVRLLGALQPLRVEPTMPSSPTRGADRSSRIRSCPTGTPRSAPVASACTGFTRTRTRSSRRRSMPGSRSPGSSSRPG